MQSLESKALKISNSIGSVHSLVAFALIFPATPNTACAARNRPTVPGASRARAQHK